VSRARTLLLAALAACLASAPVAAAGSPPDLSNAAAAILIDSRDGTVLLQKDPHEQRSIASTTKLMTALLALEEARPRERFTAPPYNALPVESKINLRAGEQMTVADLLQALLLESANDAAVTIADGVSGSRDAFVTEMNDRAAELGLADTSYANPIGLDDPLNYSSASDLAALSRKLMRNKRFARIVDMPSAVLESGDQVRVVENRNNLIGMYPFVDGVKTGHTRLAGNVLVGAADGRGAQVISVVLGEPSEATRDADTLALLRYGLAQFRRRRALDEHRPLATSSIAYRDEEARLVPAHGLNVTLRRDQRLRRRVDAPDELEGPLDAGERVGSVAVYRDKELVERVPLVTAAEVPGASVLRKINSSLGAPLLVLLLLSLLLAAALRVRALGRRRAPR
jgi:serine-type D-Ala-D-Ala carboxypeptidase (penicillin-binding protein 5/6)